MDQNVYCEKSQSKQYFRANCFQIRKGFIRVNVNKGVATVSLLDLLSEDKTKENVADLAVLIISCINVHTF